MVKEVVKGRSKMRGNPKRNQLLLASIVGLVLVFVVALVLSPRRGAQRARAKSATGAEAELREKRIAEEMGKSKVSRSDPSSIAARRWLCEELNRESGQPGRFSAVSPPAYDVLRVQEAFVGGLYGPYSSASIQGFLEPHSDLMKKLRAYDFRAVYFTDGVDGVEVPID